MRYKPKSKKSLLIILVIAAIAVGIAYFTGFANLRSATRIGYLGNEGRNSWSGSYTMLDGAMKKTLQSNGEVLNIAVKTESGTISIEIKDADGSVIFDEESIETESFDINASGKVMVWIVADHHKGSFAISFK